MDYQELRERIIRYVVYPSDEQKETLIEGVDTIHFAMLITQDNQMHMQDTMDAFSDFIYVLEERGAIFPQDFFVTAQMVGGLQIVLHMKNEFASDEDFDPTYKRYGIRK